MGRAAGTWLWICRVLFSGKGDCYRDIQIDFREPKKMPLGMADHVAQGFNPGNQDRSKNKMPLGMADIFTAE
ncbi:hypothetical protein DHB64_17110 [Antarcticibacterium sp. W02-3]|nr:hypothetical protein [Antarcticibacterium sp. W02-3]